MGPSSGLKNLSLSTVADGPHPLETHSASAQFFINIADGNFRDRFLGQEPAKAGAMQYSARVV